MRDEHLRYYLGGAGIVIMMPAISPALSPLWALLGAAIVGYGLWCDAHAKDEDAAKRAFHALLLGWRRKKSTFPLSPS